MLPDVIPVSVPALLMDAMPPGATLHTPPPAALLNDIDDPEHTTDGPTIVPAAGDVLTVTVLPVFTVPQLFVTVYCIVSVPMLMAVTTPVGDTVHMPAVVCDHTPPGLVSLNVAVLPGHSVDTPVIVPASGSGLTVMFFTALAAPQLLLTV